MKKSKKVVKLYNINLIKENNKYSEKTNRIQYI